MHRVAVAAMEVSSAAHVFSDASSYRRAMDERHESGITEKNPCILSLRLRSGQACRSDPDLFHQPIYVRSLNDASCSTTEKRGCRSAARFTPTSAHHEFEGSKTAGWRIYLFRPHHGNFHGPSLESACASWRGFIFVAPGITGYLSLSRRLGRYRKKCRPSRRRQTARPRH